MSKTRVISDNKILLKQLIGDYLALFKVRLSLTVVFSAVVAFLIASGGDFKVKDVVILAIGGFLITASANTFNQILEKDFDLLMKRTENRPLPQNRMTIVHAIIVGGITTIIGLFFLAMFNPWTAILGMFSLVLYAFVYTPWKRISPVAVFVGAIPGALPVVIGCVAAEGEFTTLALVLFAIQFFWQFPHFWAIAWVSHEDYSNAGFRLLPSASGEPDSSVGFQSFVYALYLVPVMVSMYFTGLISILGMTILILLSMLYAGLAWKLFKQCDKKAALKLMFGSFLYLPLALLVIFLIG